MFLIDVFNLIFKNCLVNINNPSIINSIHIFIYLALALVVNIVNIMFPCLYINIGFQHYKAQSISFICVFHNNTKHILNWNHLFIYF